MIFKNILRINVTSHRKKSILPSFPTWSWKSWSQNHRPHLFWWRSDQPDGRRHTQQGQKSLLKTKVIHINIKCYIYSKQNRKVRRFNANLSVPWSGTMPPASGKWICRSCWVLLWWQSCFPLRCRHCWKQAAAEPFAPELDDDLAW